MYNVLLGFVLCIMGVVCKCLLCILLLFIIDFQFILGVFYNIMSGAFYCNVARVSDKYDTYLGVLYHVVMLIGINILCEFMH